MKAILILISSMLLTCGDSVVAPEPDPPPPLPAILGEQLDVIVCKDGNNTSRKTTVQNLMGNKATLIPMHTGWCGACKMQTITLEAQYQKYKNGGFETILILLQDDRRNTDYNSLLEYACHEKMGRGFTFSIAIDPGAAFYNKYSSRNVVPINILLDRDGNTILNVPGYPADFINSSIEELLKND